MLGMRWHALEDVIVISLLLERFGKVNFLLYDGSVCLLLLSSFSLLLSPLLWITSSMVSHVIVHYENKPLTTSGFRVIVKADFWALSRILRRF